MKKTLSALVAVAILSLGAAFADDKAAAPKTTTASTASTATTASTASTATHKKHKKAKAPKPADAGTASMAPAPSTK
jgi:hypothetical protein